MRFAVTRVGQACAVVGVETGLVYRRGITGGIGTSTTSHTVVAIFSSVLVRRIIVIRLLRRLDVELQRVSHTVRKWLRALRRCGNRLTIHLDIPLLSYVSAITGNHFCGLSRMIGISKFSIFRQRILNGHAGISVGARNGLLNVFENLRQFRSRTGGLVVALVRAATKRYTRRIIPSNTSIIRIIAGHRIHKHIGFVRLVICPPIVRSYARVSTREDAYAVHTNIRIFQLLSDRQCLVRNSTAECSIRSRHTIGKEHYILDCISSRVPIQGGLSTAETIRSISGTLGF